MQLLIDITAADPRFPKFCPAATFTFAFPENNDESSVEENDDPKDEVSISKTKKKKSIDFDED